MRRPVVLGIVLVVAIFGAVYYARRGPVMPVSALLAYDFQPGTNVTYDVSLRATTTVGNGGSRSSSLTTVDVPVHANVISKDATGIATIKMSLDQPTVRVDGKLVNEQLQVTSAVLRLRDDGQVISVDFPGAGHKVTVRQEGDKGSVQIGTATSQGGTDPLQNVLLIAQDSMPSLPGGQIAVGNKWSRPVVINAPYLLLQTAIGNSKLDGFEQRSDVYVARVTTHVTTPIDLQTYQANGAPLHIVGLESLSVTGYFAPGHGVVGTKGTGVLDVTQAVSAGSSSSTSGGLRVSTAPTHSRTNLSFTVNARQP